MIALVIVLAIIAVIAGYFFIKKYNDMDKALFGDIKGYHPIGIYLVYISVTMGAIFGGLFLYQELGDESLNTDMFYVLVYTIMSLILCTSIYQSILIFDSAELIIGKSLWTIFSCALAFIIGAAGSFIVFCVVVLWIMWLFVKLSINSFIYSETIKDEDGNTHRVRKRFSLFNDDTYEDEEGNVFKRKKKY